MNWRKKMENVLCSVLDNETDKYYLSIIAENGFSIMQNEKIILETIGSQQVSSHWREYIRKAIHTIIDEKINHQIKQYV